MGNYKQELYKIVRDLNNCLHFQCGMTDLKNRTVFTACAITSMCNGIETPLLYDGLTGTQIYTGILNNIKQMIDIAAANANGEREAQSYRLIPEVFSEIRMNNEIGPEILAVVTDRIRQARDLIDQWGRQREWDGEDIMGVLFREFTRYQAKTVSGQVFTPDHIVSFVNRIMQTEFGDPVLDAACGSGAFLINAAHRAARLEGMQCGQLLTSDVYGIEFDREIYTLACMSFMSRGIVTPNLVHMDSRNSEAGEWIADRICTPAIVMMNLPFEAKYGCLDILKMVLDSVPAGSTAAIIMPDRKLEKKRTVTNRILEKHTLETVIKLPEDLFREQHITSSLFIFKTGKPQNNSMFCGMEIKHDGFHTVKNEGRQDTDGVWRSIEGYWTDVYDGRKQDSSMQMFNPAECLSYNKTDRVREHQPIDLSKSVMDYLISKSGIDAALFTKQVAEAVMYGNMNVTALLDDRQVSETQAEEPAKYAEIKLTELFNIQKGKRIPGRTVDGEIPYIGASKYNNGVTKCIDCPEEFVFDGGKITVAYNGSIGSAFYQEDRFVASDDVIVCTPKFKITLNIALFLCACIRQAGGAFGYYEKWSQKEMKKTSLCLPVTETGEPDWVYMEEKTGKIMKTKQEHLRILNQIVSECAVI